MKFTNHYTSKLAEYDLEPDAAQLQAVEALDDLWVALEQTSGSGWLSRLVGKKKAPAPRGLYLWGGVGRGKTFLMDLFFDVAPVKKKFRIHFHRFMRLVHEELKQLERTSDPLDHVADRLADKYRLICFDEFFVSDIADAMILGRLLGGLFERGITLVTTSNSAPADLYRDGLQRQRFLPAIALLESHCRVMNIDGGVDYRLRQLESASIYLTPVTEGTEGELRCHFDHIAPGGSVERRVMRIEGRDVCTIRCAKGIAWFEFHAICDGPRSQNDYIELARLFHTVLIENVPVFTRETENQARRFIALVDEFYDRRVKLILSAAADIDRLYQGRRLEFEFERTRSRLIEMQSHDYLAQAHIA